MNVKICGLKTFDDALASAEAGADLLGFNFYKSSPRYVTPDDALSICTSLRAQLGAACPSLVGLFVNDVVGTISVITAKVGLPFAQLSGDESDSMLKELRGMAFKSIRPMNKAMALDDVNYYTPVFPINERIPSLLLDAYHPKLYGGTGEQASVEVALAVRDLVPRMMLAGGLTPENVAVRIQSIRPWGVDVASGVEIADQPGVKDHTKLRDFIQAAKNA